MSRRVMIVGGPRDGEMVPWQGTQMLEPVARRRSYVHPEDVLPAGSDCGYEIRRYRAYQWFDGISVVWRYVADEYAKGLGCP